jgi:hypothetical protein
VDDAGVPQRNRNLANDLAKLIPVLGALSPGTPVAFEAAYGWGWLVDLLEELVLQPEIVTWLVRERLSRPAGRAATGDDPVVCGQPKITRWPQATA